MEENPKLVPVEQQQLAIMKHQEQKLDVIRDEQRIAYIDIKKNLNILTEENSQLKKEIGRLLNQLEILNQELEQRKNKEFAREERKKKWAKRKRLPKRDPMTLETYKKLMDQEQAPTYLKARLRLALCILFVTGIRLNELLPLRVYQLKTLFEEGWIGIDRSKRGPSNHKAFLTAEGKKVLKERAKDYALICLLKKPEDFIFTAEKHPQTMLTRETLTKTVNQAMRKLSKTLIGGPNITSHSFRIGYITKLWRDTNDLEFVRQSIGHRGIETTSGYVTQLSDKEREAKMAELI